MIFVSRKESTIFVLASALSWLAAAGATHAQTPAALAATKEQVRELHAKSARVKITVLPKRTLTGQIVQVANETFVVRGQGGAEETLEYARVVKIGKQGIRKSVLIPVVAAGAALVVFCAAPYPLGFLCRRDPS
jgi:hypothetical protein